MTSWIKKKPFSKLTRRVVKRAGRNRRGVITVRHRGGGQPQTLRIIDFHRSLWNVPGLVLSIERSSWTAYIALIAYPIGILSYITAPRGLQMGDVIMAGWKLRPDVGNAMPIMNIPLNTKVHNIESRPGSGAVFARAAGTWGTIVEASPEAVVLLLRSGIKKRLSPYCLATVGRVANINNNNQKFYKAGQSRGFSRRPSVRGVAMNPVDHPHGGGKGKKSKNAVPQSPWGRLGKGQKTVKLKK